MSTRDWPIPWPPARLDSTMWGAAGVIGAILGMMAALLSPLWSLLIVFGLAGVVLLVAGWPVAPFFMLHASALLTRYRWDFAGVNVRAEHVAILLLGALIVWLSLWRRERLIIGWAGVFAIGWWLSNVAATSLSAVAPADFRLDPADSVRHLIRLSLMVGAYLVTVNLLRTPQQWRMAFKIFLFLGALQALFGLIAVAVWPTYNLGIQYYRHLPVPVPYGTMEEGNIFGSHSATWALAFGVLILVHFHEAKKISKWWYLGLAITGLALVASLARGAWLAFCVSLALTFILYARRFSDQVYRLLMVALAAPLALAAIVLAVLSLPDWIPMVERLRTFTELATDPTFSARLESYELAYYEWMSRPWIGLGPGAHYQIQGIVRWEPAWIGNHVMRTLQETGLIGMFCFVGYLLAVLVGGWRHSARVSTGDRAALLGLTIGLFCLYVAYQATDGTWIAAPWIHAGLLAAGVRVLPAREANHDTDYVMRDRDSCKP